MDSLLFVLDYAVKSTDLPVFKYRLRRSAASGHTGMFFELILQVIGTEQIVPIFSSSKVKKKLKKKAQVCCLGHVRI